MTSLQCRLTNQHDAQIRSRLTPAFGSPHVMLRRTPSATRDACAVCCPARRSLRAIEVSLMKLYFSVTCICLLIHQYMAALSQTAESRSKVHPLAQQSGMSIP